VDITHINTNPIRRVIMSKRRHTREEAEGMLDLIRGTRDALNREKELVESMRVLTTEPKSQELFMEYEFVGKLVSGELEIEPYTVTENCLRSQGLKEACIKIYETHNNVASKKQAIRELNQKLGVGWTPAAFFDADIELWPYDDRAIRFGHANLVRVIKWGG
jgi:hypothetical protein